MCEIAREVTSCTFRVCQASRSANSRVFYDGVRNYSRISFRLDLEKIMDDAKKDFASVHMDVNCDMNYVPSAIEIVESEFPGSPSYNFAKVLCINNILEVAIETRNARESSGIINIL